MCRYSRCNDLIVSFSYFFSKHKETEVFPHLIDCLSRLLGLHCPQKVSVSFHVLLVVPDPETRRIRQRLSQTFSLDLLAAVHSFLRLLERFWIGNHFSLANKIESRSHVFRIIADLDRTRKRIETKELKGR